MCYQIKLNKKISTDEKRSLIEYNMLDCLRASISIDIQNEKLPKNWKSDPRRNTISTDRSSFDHLKQFYEFFMYSRNKTFIYYLSSRSLETRF